MDIKAYAQLSAHVYHKELKDNRMTIPNEFKKLAWKKDDPISGFSAGAYQNTATNEIVIAFAGTNEQDGDRSKLDWRNNVEMGLGANSTIDAESQFVQAIKFVLQVMEKHPNTPISFTGHSLGVEIPSVVYSISRRILKHEHAQKHPSHPVSGFGYPQRHHAPSRVAAVANLLGRGCRHRNTHHPRHARARRKNPPLQRLAGRV